MNDEKQSNLEGSIAVARKNPFREYLAKFVSKEKHIKLEKPARAYERADNLATEYDELFSRTDVENRIECLDDMPSQTQISELTARLKSQLLERKDIKPNHDKSREYNKQYLIKHPQTFSCDYNQYDLGITKLQRSYVHRQVISIQEKIDSRKMGIAEYERLFESNPELVILGMLMEYEEEKAKH